MRLTFIRTILVAAGLTTFASGADALLIKNALLITVAPGQDEAFTRFARPRTNASRFPLPAQLNQSRHICHEFVSRY